MVGLAALCLLLVFPLSNSQSTLRSEQEIPAHQAPAAHPPPPHIGELLRNEETTHLNAKQTCKCSSRKCSAEQTFISTLPNVNVIR